MGGVLGQAFRQEKIRGEVSIRTCSFIDPQILIRVKLQFNPANLTSELFYVFKKKSLLISPQ
jgi:hypothetical protein